MKAPSDRLQNYSFQTFFRSSTGLAIICKGACPNCRNFPEKFFRVCKIWMCQYHIFDYFSDVISPLIISGRPEQLPRWSLPQTGLGLMERIWQKTNAHNFYKQHEGRRQIGRPRVDGRIMSKFILKEYDGKARAGFVCLRIGSHFGFHDMWEFCLKHRDFYSLQKGSVPRIYLFIYLLICLFILNISSKDYI